MKRLIIILPVFLLLCSASQSRAANYYWGGDLGLSLLEFNDFTLTIKNVSTYRRQAIDLKHRADSTAFGAAFVYGLDFGWAGRLPLRLEFESALSGGVTSTGKSDYYLTPQGIPLIADVKMQLDVNWLYSAGFNLWLDIPVGRFPLKPYLGGGLGYDFIYYDCSVIINPNSPGGRAGAEKSGNAQAFHYKLGGGARLAIGKRTFLDFGLRYAKKQDWNIHAAHFNLDFSSRALNAGLGLRYYF